MKRALLTTILVLGFVPAAMAQDKDVTAEYPDIPAEGEATLADCRTWVSTRGELVEKKSSEPVEGATTDVDAAQQEAMEHCDAGDYHQGIITAAKAIDEIEGTDRLGEAGITVKNGGSAADSAPAQDSDTAEPGTKD